MCLAIPGRVIELYEQNGLKMGRLDYAGTINTACFEYVPEVQVGQYALVHAGFAISLVDEEEAQKTYAIWNELVQAAAQEGTDVFGMPFDDAERRSQDQGGSA